MTAPTLAQFIASQAANYDTVREYIGARYVPVFANPLEWSDTRGYEPLTIVLHQGNSYTSMQAVPTGIDIGNTAFWALTGNYNAQVEAYRAEVQQYQQTVTGFDARITANTEAIATNTEDIAANMGEIGDIKQITGKISFDSHLSNVSFVDTNNRNAVGLTYHGVDPTGEYRNGLVADNKTGLYFYDFANSKNLWSLALRTIGIKWLNVQGVSFDVPSSPIDGVGLRQFKTEEMQNNESFKIYANGRNMIFYEDGQIVWGWNPIRRITSPITGLQVALQHNVAVINVLGMSLTLSNPGNWQTIATPQQLGITAAASESAMGVLWFNNGQTAPLSLGSQGLRVYVTSDTVGTHTAYGQVTAIVNVTFESKAAMTLDLDNDAESQIIPNDGELATFVIDDREA